MPVAYAPAGGSVEVDDRPVEAVGHLHEDAGAVAGVGLGAGRAAVVQVAHRGERLVDDRVALAALHVDDEPDAARVVLEARVVEPLGVGQIAIAHSGSSPVSSVRGRAVSPVRAPRREEPGWEWPPRDDIGPTAERQKCSGRPRRGRPDFSVF